MNSPNRILLLHHSIICFALSAVYLWLLINNSIMLSIVSSASSATFDLVAASSLTTTVSNIASSSTAASTTSTDMSEALTTQSIDTIYDPFCSINDVFIHLLQPLSLWTISCINFDRYYAICSPLHYNTLFTTRKVSFEFDVRLKREIFNQSKFLLFSSGSLWELQCLMKYRFSLDIQYPHHG